MSDQKDTTNGYQESVDQLFSLVNEAATASPAAASVDGPVAETVEPNAKTTASTPAEQEPALATLAPTPSSFTEWQDEWEWIKDERKRLEVYTQNQFALIKQQREELLGRRAGIEESLALREQELNRHIQKLAEGAALVERRHRELADREFVVNAAQDRLSNAQQELQALQQANAHYLRENETHLLLAEQLRLQTAQLQEETRSVRSELTILEQTAQRKRKEALLEKVELTVARRQLEERMAAQEKSEESLRRRVAEIDQLEAQIRRELDQREHQLEQEHQELERARAALKRQKKASTEQTNGKHQLAGS